MNELRILLRRTVVLTKKGFIAGHQGANGIVSVLQHPENINYLFTGNRIEESRKKKVIRKLKR